MMFVVFFVVMVWSAFAVAQPACTHYAAVAGTGSTCTVGTPCLMNTFVTSGALAVPGNTLCLNDGNHGQLFVPTTFNGTSSNRITIRALNEGQASLNTGAGSRPVHIQGSWGLLWGVNVIGGDNATLRLANNSSNWLVQRVNVKAVGAVDNAVNVEGNNHVLEDFTAYGQARYMVAAAVAGGGNHHNTFRRGWVRWQDNQFTASNPTGTLLMGYGQDTVTVENMVMTWATTGRTSSPEGIALSWRTQNSKFLGSIAYVLAGTTFNPTPMFGFTTDAGSQAQEGNFHPTQNLVFKHNVAFISPSHADFGSKRGFEFSECTDSGCQSGANNLVQDSVSVAGVNDTFSSTSWTVSGIQHGTSLSAAIGSGNSVWTQSNAGPGICKQYVAGVLTSTVLWPFSMNQRLIDFMTSQGDSPVDVTATVEGLLGTIPGECKTGGSGDVTAPTVSVTAPVQSATVSGVAVAVSADASDNVAVAGVQFKLDGVNLGSEDTSSPYGITWDTTTTGEGSHSLTAVARDSNNNTTLSAAVMVNVDNVAEPTNVPRVVRRVR